MTSKRAIQDFYPENLAHCYGCGAHNPQGLQLKTYWAEDEADTTITCFMPKPYHTAIPGFVYGGLIASLIDCHGTGTAALAAYRAEGREPGSDPPLRFVTAHLAVDFLKPTPLGPRLTLRGKVTEIKGRKVVVAVSVWVDAQMTAQGEVVAVRMPENFGF
ncbi:MAG: PaaI family thioesterase [Rhodocyclaceae bacterium]|nr:PaaI family thioesterase [Rhodocyclaceae bacterium]